MNKARLIGLAAATAAVSAVLTPPAQAGVAEHCPSGGTKYEVNAGPDLYIGDVSGTVCIKTGTQAYDVPVVDGVISSTVWNRPGNARLGISYYVIYCVDDPYTYENECTPDPS